VIKFKEEEMGGVCGTYGGEKCVQGKRDLGVDGRKIFKGILM
jgi:hypothetical protein